MRHERHDWIDCFDGASATTLDFDAVGVQNVQDFQDAAHVRLAGHVKQLKKSEHILVCYAKGNCFLETITF